MAKLVQIRLSRDQTAFIELEKKRLKTERNLSTTTADIIRGILNLHMQRWGQIADVSPEAVPLLHLFLVTKGGTDAEEDL